MEISMMQRKERRIPLACSNCRRKKTRCPGERPACSTCRRLNQSCEYPGTNGRAKVALHERVGGSTQSLEARLSEVEDRLNSIFDDARLDPREENGSSDSTPVPDQHVGSLSQNHHTSLIPKSRTLTYSMKSLTDAIQFYSLHCHRQPLWLFESEDSIPTATCPQELAFAILALVSLHTPNCLQLSSGLNFDVCCNTARSLILGKIADGEVILPTIQALCLLALTRFAATDISVSRWYIDTAKSLMRSCAIHVKSETQQDSRDEEKRRLFWSIFHLDQLCGTPVMSPVLQDIDHPIYATLVGHIQSKKLHCPSLPSEAHQERETKGPGIWAHLVRLSTLWPAVKNYIYRYESGDIQVPWSPSSEYCLINSQILDFETRFLDYYRYPNAKFSARSVEEIAKNRQCWLPWVSIQLTYHTFHAILNHPFLHAVAKSTTRFGQNVFWKTSAEASLLHANWISRIIDMCTDRKLAISDPFLAYPAAVAASLHLYSCHAADDAVRSAAKSKLKTCRSLITGLAKQWPICAMINNALTRMIELSENRNAESAEQAGRVVLNTVLMWKLLDYDSAKYQTHHSGSLFHPSLRPETVNRGDDDINTAVEDLGSPSAALNSTSDEEYAQPVNWFDAVTSPSKRQADIDANTVSTRGNIPQSFDFLPASNDNWSFDPMSMPMLPNDTLIDINDLPMMQIYNTSIDAPTWWDYGNL